LWVKRRLKFLLIIILKKQYGTAQKAQNGIIGMVRHLPNYQPYFFRVRFVFRNATATPQNTFHHIFISAFDGLCFPAFYYEKFS
jgi:hypothetical protein